MATVASDKVDYRLLNRLSNLVICSQCLRNGTVKPVPQVISRHKSLTNLCGDCRSEGRPGAHRAGFGKLLPFRRR
jgi:hypothetical protein